MTPAWEVLLDGPDREQALETVARIASATPEVPADWRGLMGRAGVAVFLAQAEASEIVGRYSALDVLEQGIAECAGARIGVGLWTGAAGLRWAVSELAGGEDAADILARLDEAIHARLAQPETDADGYDLYAGLAGVLLAYSKDDGRRDAILARVLECFERIDLCQLPRRERGCAHGVAGVLGALAACRARGSTDARLEPLMLSIAAVLGDLDVSDQRIGWCRGEPGISCAMLSAGVALRRDDLVDAAVSTMLAPFERGAGRWPLDACLCHGAAGLAHLCNRMYQVTGNGRIGEYARTWLRKTMAIQSGDRGIAAASIRRSPTTTWSGDASLLVGTAGVGLALLAGATSMAPRWDHILGLEMAQPVAPPFDRVGLI